MRTVVAARTQRDGLFDEVSLGIGHQQLWRVRELREARAEPRHDADARGQHFAVVAPRLGRGDDEQLGQ